MEDIDENSFRADFKWHAPRPLLLNAITLHATQAVIDFACYIAPEDSDPIVEGLRELQKRARLLSRLHEEFLILKLRDI
ncbi:hypothetical protein AAW31_10250 [Nitrosomonas communis]|uniref:Uncharacterized protein n=1 Tax=Nitrosomonas communis TaxID=44574 RepID=A0A0F7KC84_9PROT|nr:hypothetical protein AAW31_10250 [Nitrosomonas communis]